MAGYFSPRLLYAKGALIVSRRSSFQRQFIHIKLYWYGVIAGEAGQAKNVLGQGHCLFAIS